MANIPPSELLELFDAEAQLMKALRITPEESRQAIIDFIDTCKNGVISSEHCPAGQCLKPELTCPAFQSYDQSSPPFFECFNSPVRIRRSKFEHYFSISQSPPTEKISKDIGGRPSKYNWADFDKEMLKVATHPDGFDSVGGKQGLVKHMEKWCADNWAEQPVGSQIRDHVAKRYPN